MQLPGLSAVFDADLVGDTGMTVPEVFVFAVAVDISLYGLFPVFDKPFDHRDQIKTTVGAFLAHTVHVKDGVVTRNEVDRTLHQNRSGRIIMIIGHPKNDARYARQAVRYQTGGEHGVSF